MTQNPNKSEYSDNNEKIGSQKIVKQWFEARKGRFAAFYKKYYSESDKPSLRWVTKVIKNPSRPDGFNIWLNAFEFFLEAKKKASKESELASEIISQA